MAKSKGSGFSGSVPTIDELATKLAERDLKYNVRAYDPYAVRNLPTFVTDKLSLGEISAASNSDSYVKRETEKAVLIGYSTDRGEVTLWSPKSVIKPQDELRERAFNAIKRVHVNGFYNEYIKETPEIAAVMPGDYAKRTKVKNWDSLKKRIKWD